MEFLSPERACLSSWCLVIVMSLLLTVLWVGLQCVIVVFPDYTHLHFLRTKTRRPVFEW